MQKLWKVVESKGVITKKQGAAIRQRLRHPNKSLRAIAADMAKWGMTNGGGRPIHPQQLNEMVHEGVARMNAYLNNRPLERSRKYVGSLLREKAVYSCSTTDDPYLKGRLGFWRWRKAGKKWSGSTYDRRGK